VVPIDAQGRTVSDDGRYWWSGSQWIPIDSLAPAPPQGMGAYSVRVVPTNSLAIASAVVGGLSWFICPIIGAVTAVVMGHMAKGEIRRTQEGGWGLATAGQVLGYAHLAVWGLVLLVFFSVCGGLAALGTLGAGSH
jgi:Domain of unknown function (DUF4190)